MRVEVVEVVSSLAALEGPCMVSTMQTCISAIQPDNCSACILAKAT
jgi:hypothetical protein